MKPLQNAAAAICLGISLFAFQPVRASAAADVNAQQSGALSGGGLYVVRHDGTVGNAVIELWFRAPGAGYDGAHPGLSRLAVTAVAASRPAAHDTSLAEAVQLVGGRLSIAAYPDIVTVGASVPAPAAAKIVRAMTRAYFTAQISPEAFKSARRDAALAVAEKHYSADRTIHDLLFAQLFASGPAHYPPTPDTVQAVDTIALDQTQTFARRAFRRGNAVLTLAGNVDPHVTGNVWQPSASAASASSPPSASMDRPFDSMPGSAPKDASQAGAVAGAGLAWIGPAITNARADTALDFVADYLFNADSGLVTKTADAIDPDAFINGQFVTLHDPGVMLVTISSAKSSVALRQKVLDALASLQRPLDASAFAAARNAFEYHILSNVQTPVNQADNFGWYAVEGNPQYAPGDASRTYVTNVESLDPQFVAQVVRQYLQHPVAVELTPAAHSQEGAQ
ncbi:MAG TPA: hypothetical protein VIG51_01265 [Candidatus Baltobacteraceae bacterium]|jgi:predicted Zn-dependent peptidase